MHAWALGSSPDSLQNRQLHHGGVLGPKELTKLLIMDGLALREVRKQHHTTN
jgi:hypothetical protein